jgi:hypothetical protein
MKKLFTFAFALALLSLTACHYGQDEARKTIEANEKYKSENKDYSVNRAGERGKKSTASAEAVETAE